MSGPDLVLHIGMPRSGTMLRRALGRLRPQLRAHGLAYVGGAEIERLPHAASWTGGGPTSRGDEATFARELCARVAAERRHARGITGLRSPQVIVSSDRLLGSGDVGPGDADQFRPAAADAVAQVIEALSARSVRLVLHTQRQDRLMELAYLQRISAGERAGFEEDFPYRFEPVLDYVALIARLRAVPHVSDIVVRPVELADGGSHAFVNEFLDVFGLENALDLYVMGCDVASYGDAYSARGAQLALAMHPLLDSGGEVRQVSKYLAEHYRVGERYDTNLLDRASRQRILDCYAASNHVLFSRHMPYLPPNSYADDTATFALGNVLAQPAAPPLAVTLRSAASARGTAARLTLGRDVRHVAGRLRRRARRLR